MPIWVWAAAGVVTGSTFWLAAAFVLDIIQRKRLEATFTAPKLAFPNARVTCVVNCDRQGEHAAIIALIPTTTKDTTRATRNARPKLPRRHPADSGSVLVELRANLPELAAAGHSHASDNTAGATRGSLPELQSRHRA
jgi:hypothetical protein